MKINSILLSAMFYISPVLPSYAQENSVYSGNDLGVCYSPKETIFKVWAPNAEKVVLRLFTDGDKGEAFRTLNLDKQKQGVWQAIIKKNIKNNSKPKE